MSRPGANAADAATEFQRIGAYGLLADCNSAALVDRAGSISWLCLPRYDSPAIFARILDPDGGHWLIRPTGDYRSERQYLPGTLVIETTFTTDLGSVKLRDAMVFAEEQRHHELGRGAPHMLLRLVEGVVGEVELELELAPRPEYGLVRPLFRQTDCGGRTFGGPNQVVISAGVATAIADSTMRATFTIRAGERVGFALQWASPEGPAPEAFSPDDVVARIEDTISTRARIVSWCGSAPGCSRGLPIVRRARSSLLRRRLCPRRSAASAIGTIATPGSVTRA
jgi:alpha,alpha-trehalase